MKRWRFETLNKSETYIFDFNPNAAQPPASNRDITWNYSWRSGFTGLRSGRTPVRWAFSGIIRNRSQYDAFIEWVGKGEKIRLITDLDEVHLLRLIAFAPQQSAPSSNLQRYTYEMTALLYDDIGSSEPPTSPRTSVRNINPPILRTR